MSSVFYKVSEALSILLSIVTYFRFTHSRIFASEDSASFFKYLINSPIRGCGLPTIELNMRYHPSTALLALLVLTSDTSLVAVPNFNWNVWIVQRPIHEVIKNLCKCVTFLYQEVMVSHQRGEHLRLSQGRFSCESVKAASGVDETLHINLSCSLIRKTLVGQICYFYQNFRRNSTTTSVFNVTTF